MHVADFQKEYIRDLLIHGRRFEAIRYLRSNFDLNYRQAKGIVVLIAQDISDDEYVVKSSFVKSRIIYFAALALLIGGMFSILSAGYFWVNNYLFRSNAYDITSIVVEDGEHPVFQYQYEGNTYEYRSVASYAAEDYHVNDLQILFINTENPQRVLVDNFTERWLNIVLFLSGGVITLILGIVALNISRR